MPKRLAPPLICLFGFTLLLSGCKPKTPEPVASPTRSVPFKTTFQEESQFIVESTVSDLAQQLYYAARHQLPDRKEFRVSANERRSSPANALVYDLEIRFDSKVPALTGDIQITGPIWSPALYGPIARKIADSVGLKIGQTGPNEATVMPKLTDSNPETIEREDRDLSLSLEKDFSNPEFHERAALLLGLFLFRDHSGHFLEMRTSLSRMAAHLAMAQVLQGTNGYGPNGRLAEATLLTLINSETSALERLNAMPTNQAEAVGLVRALRCRATGDYRPIGQLKDASPTERVEYFCSKAGYVSTAAAWLDLSDAEKQTIDFVRTAHHQKYSVEMGHQLLENSVQLEMGEISSIYGLTHGDKLKRSQLVEALNQLPEGSFVTDSAGQVRVQVIGWGQWAGFLQRHLCHAIQQDYYFLSSMLGDPDAAKQFAAQAEDFAGGLRLYSLVRRFNCRTIDEYHKSIVEGLELTTATPHLVPAECWNYLSYKVRFAPLYSPGPNHINQWFRHDPPPGTAYDLLPRLYHHSLSDDAEAVANLEKLHELAPYDARLSFWIVRKKYNDHPTYEQAMALYGPELSYSVFAMHTVADAVKNKPDQYEKLMQQAAELDSSCYYDLGDYFIERGQEEKGAKYIDQACDRDPDAVRASNHSVWRVQHCFRTGELEKARKIADEAAEVYSARGLEAKAIFLEGTTNYDGAFEWFSKMEERYDQSIPLIAFCVRYQAQTGNQRFAPEVKKRLSKLFPEGVEKVSLDNFHTRPTDGVLIRQQNELLKAAGLKAGDVIVAVYGTRVHNFLQYLYSRDLKQTPELDLIVWQGDAYRQFSPSPPHHKFGVEFDDYVPQCAGLSR